MKKSYCVIIAFLLLNVVACTSSDKPKQESSSDSVENVSQEKIETPCTIVFHNVELSDSILNANNTGNLYKTELYCQWMPKSENVQFSVLCDSVNSWICQLFCDSSCVMKDDISTLANRFSDSNMKNMKEYLTEDEFFSDPNTVLDEPLTQEYKVSLLYENDTLVTMGFSDYEYLYGAHGSYVYVGATFNKQTGHRYDSDLLEKYGKSKQDELIKNGLKQYFEVSSDEELFDLLTLDDNKIPFPSNLYVTDKGIVASYQVYEIGCYAMGMPSFLIPFE